MSFDVVRRELLLFRDSERAQKYQKFFQTHKGGYGEGDQFLGITVPHIRKIVKQHAQLSLNLIVRLVISKFHEERMCGLLMLVEKYKRGNSIEQKNIYSVYVAHSRYINNWDLIDVTAPHIIGAYVYKQHTRKILVRLSKSKMWYERRIAIVATLMLIRYGELTDTIALSEILLHDEHELVRKAVGWMLREVGKKNEIVLLNFLDAHAREMPRTMLRYSLENLSKEHKQTYMRI